MKGSLTQSVEYLPFKQRVARSSRARPTIETKSSSSSQVQDTGLSRRQHRFKSGWGRQILKGALIPIKAPFVFILSYPCLSLVYVAKYLNLNQVFCFYWCKAQYPKGYCPSPFCKKPPICDTFHPDPDNQLYSAALLIPLFLMLHE